jgi:hypothetical protein
VCIPRMRSGGGNEKTKGSRRKKVVVRVEFFVWLIHTAFRHCIIHEGYKESG